MSVSNAQAGLTESDDITGEHGTLSLPVLEPIETDDELAVDDNDDDDRSRGFDPYNSGSFVLKK